MEVPDGEVAVAADGILTPARHWRNLFPDPKDLWIVFRRNLRPFLVVFLLVIGAVAAWTLTRTPVYSAMSSLLVLPQADQVVKVDAVTPDLPATTDIVNTEVRLMQSSSLALRVAERYAAQHPDADIVRSKSREELADVIAAMVNISRSASTYVIEVYATSSDAQQATDIANLYVTEFVAADRESKVNTNSAANTWLRSRTAQLAEAATRADADLQAYKVSHGLISSDGTTLSEQEISTLDGQIASAQADLAEKQGRLSAARKQLSVGGSGADVGEALESGTIGTLRAREAEASAQVANLSARYGEKYPDLVQARSQLASIRQDIQLEINRILSNLQAEVNVSSSRLSSLQGSRAQSTGVLSNNNRAQVGLQSLQRSSDAAKAIYETFLNRTRETAAQQGLQRADTRVDSVAQVPDTPDFPNRRLAAVFGILGGVVGGVIAIALAEYLQGTMRSKADVEQRLGARYAGAIPSLKSTLGKIRADQPPHEYILSYPQSTFAESFRSLRAHLVPGGGTAAGGRAIAIASALPQEGKTTTAVCLARLSAASGIPTVLVDCDLRRRGSSELLNNQNNGLYDYFAGASLDEALTLDEASGLRVLGTMPGSPDASDPLTGENLARMIRDLRARFQLIVIDTAPVLGLADARIVAAAADRVVMCAKWRKTSVKAANATVELLVSSGARLSGVVLTQVDIKSYASTGYTESYNYHKRFRGYYIN
jgi:capsular exopolysaccharide synthesis family protein